MAVDTPPFDSMGGPAPVKQDEFQRVVVNESLQSAIENKEANGGGVLIVPPGTYEPIAIGTVEDASYVRVIADNARIEATANNQTLVYVEIGVGLGPQRSKVEGFVLDGGSFTGVTGAEVADSDGASALDLRIEDCATGFRFHSKNSGKWVERCLLADTFIVRCDVGIEYLVTGGNPSFNEVALSNVSITGSDICIAQREGADFTRARWDNVTCWPGNNGTGVLFDGRLDHSRLQFGVEALNGDGISGVIGVHVGPNFTFYSDARSMDLDISFVGTFADRVLDDSTGDGIVWRDGGLIWSSKYASPLTMYRDGEAHPRASLNVSGLQIGPGDVAPTNAVQAWYANLLRANGLWLFQSRVGFATAAATGPVGTVVGKYQVMDKDGNNIGWVPVYNSIT